jgi:hypothetical protein
MEFLRHSFSGLAGLMVPLLAPKCGRMSQQLGQKRKLHCWRVSTDCESGSAAHVIGVLVNLVMELSTMSNTSVRFALALCAVFASLGASFDRPAGSATTRSIPMPIGSSGTGKCFQDSRATPAERKRAEFVHSDGVCWAPQNISDWPGV